MLNYFPDWKRATHCNEATLCDMDKSSLPNQFKDFREQQCSYEQPIIEPIQPKRAEGGKKNAKY